VYNTISNLLGQAEQVGDHRRITGVRIVWRLSMVTQVWHQHPEPGLEPAGDRTPVGGGSEQAMD